MCKQNVLRIRIIWRDNIFSIISNNISNWGRRIVIFLSTKTITFHLWAHDFLCFRCWQKRSKFPFPLSLQLIRAAGLTSLVWPDRIHMWTSLAWCRLTKRTRIPSARDLAGMTCVETRQKIVVQFLCVTPCLTFLFDRSLFVFIWLRILMLWLRRSKANSLWSMQKAVSTVLFLQPSFSVLTKNFSIGKMYTLDSFRYLGSLPARWPLMS